MTVDSRTAPAPSSAALLRDGADTLDRSGVGTSRFCEHVEARSEFDYKRRCMRGHEVMYHAHIGLSTWPATKAALAHVTSGLEAAGHRLDRFGLCLEYAMGLPAEQRASLPKETGPRLGDEDWSDIATAAAAQPHLGDFMIGTPAALENTLAGLHAGITTLGNIGQYFAFDVPGGWDERGLRDVTLRALGAMARARQAGAQVHSYLDDGPAMQFSSYGNYLAWAALEKYIVEDLVGARVAHCFGGLVPQPAARAFLALALRHLHGAGSPGSMVYGNTVDYGQDMVRNRTVLDSYLMVDIATQLHAPTGNAVNPVPLTENIRIPSADEVLEVHLVARQVEEEARRALGLFDWPRLDAEAAAAVDYAREASGRMLELLAEDGVDPLDPGELLLALRHTDVDQLERRLRLMPPTGLARLEPWKANVRGALEEQVAATAAPRLDDMRVVVASLDVHDLARDVLLRALPLLGAEVVALPRAQAPEAVVSTAVAEDVDAIVVSTYNGGALSQGRRLIAAKARDDFDGVIVMGGVLNEDDEQDLPFDSRDELVRLGLRCPAELDEVPRALAHLAGQPAHR